MIPFARSRLPALGVALAGLAASAAVQASEPGGIEITPFLGATFGGQFDDDDTDAEIDLDDSSSFGLILDIDAEVNTQYEFLYSRQDTKFDFGTVGSAARGDVSIDYLHIGGTYQWAGEIVEPYMAATIGAARVDPDEPTFDSETYFSFALGGGVRVWPRRRFGLRLEGRVYGSLIDSDSDIFCVAGGDTNACLIRTSADVLWQWQMFAGASVRF